MLPSGLIENTGESFTRIVGIVAHGAVVRWETASAAAVPATPSPALAARAE